MLGSLFAHNVPYLLVYSSRLWVKHMEVHTEFRERQLYKESESSNNFQNECENNIIKKCIFYFIIKLLNYSLETYATFQVLRELKK